MNYRVLDELEETWSRPNLLAKSSLGSFTVFITSLFSQKSVDVDLTFCLEVYINFSQAPLLEMMLDSFGFISEVDPALSICRYFLACSSAFGIKVLPYAPEASKSRSFSLFFLLNTLSWDKVFWSAFPLRMYCLYRLTSRDYVRGFVSIQLGLIFCYWTGLVG